MNSFNKLVELFSEFPGIGPRQAKRFVYFLLTMPAAYSGELVRSLESLKANTVTCSSCFRIFNKNGSAGGNNGTGNGNGNGNGNGTGNGALTNGVNFSQNICSICADPNRDHSQLAIVSRDSDLESLEKSGSYSGLYFVLGGIVPILEQNPERKIRQKELLDTIKKRFPHDLKEIILALSANSDGENTVRYISQLLSPQKTAGLIVSELGRGLSTGTELEYSDADTLRNAMEGRK